MRRAVMRFGNQSGQLNGITSQQQVKRGALVMFGVWLRDSTDKEYSPLSLFPQSGIHNSTWWRKQSQLPKPCLYKKKEIRSKMCKVTLRNKLNGYKEFYHQGENVVWSVESQSAFRRRFCLPPAFTLVSCSDYFFPPWRWKCDSETSVDTQRTTRRYIPENITLHIHRCENLKSYNVLVCEKKHIRTATHNTATHKVVPICPAPDY
jgi:hypothetical protein